MPPGESLSQLMCGKAEEAPRAVLGQGKMLENGMCKRAEYKDLGGRGLNGNGKGITEMTLWERMNNQRDVSHASCNNGGESRLGV